MKLTRQTLKAMLGDSNAPMIPHLLVSPDTAGFVGNAPVSGVPFNYTVSALDPSNNVDTGFLNTVHFVCSDTAATLPPDHTLTAGVGVFTATLINVGGNPTLGAIAYAFPSVDGNVQFGV